MATDLRIYSARESVDYDWVFEQLKNSYWGGHYTFDDLVEAIERSVCISAWMGVDQVGFARVITDRRIVSHLTDVIVEEKFRRQGIATAMLKNVFEHPWVKPTLCICQTRHCFNLYAKFGFVMGGEVLKRNPG